MLDLFDRTKHPQQDAVDSAHDHVMRVIQLYASGLVTLPELLAALLPHYDLFPTEDDKPVAIIGVLDPATHLKRVK
jgi:hypothetical protein